VEQVAVVVKVRLVVTHSQTTDLSVLEISTVTRVLVKQHLVRIFVVVVKEKVEHQVDNV
jgi:hypothetical protein